MEVTITENKPKQGIDLVNHLLAQSFGKGFSGNNSVMNWDEYYSCGLDKIVRHRDFILFESNKKVGEFPRGTPDTYKNQ